MKKYIPTLTVCILLLFITNIIHAQTWSLTGNAGTVEGVNFIGTTDNQPLNFRVNNQKAGRLDPTYQSTFYGILAGVSNTTGSYNTATGYAALFSNTTGNYNSATGNYALYSNTTGSYNMANGYAALNTNSTGSFNLANGAYALRYNTTGNYNMANGYGALYSNTTGTYNGAIGYNALGLNTTGSQNTAVGFQALYGNTTSNNLTAIGFKSLYFNTTGAYNTALGGYSLYTNNTGINNTAVGYAALYSNTTGGYNNAVGYAALGLTTTGNQNTANGYYALRTNTTGSGNTAIGYGADVGSVGLNNTTAIGNGAIVNASNTIQLGNSSVTQVLAGTGTSATIVAGGLKIIGGTLGAGKVLTSDATGVATWQSPGNSTGWTLTGNSGTVDGTDFLGTTDDNAIYFRVNNQPAGRIEPGDVPWYGGNTFFGFQAGSATYTTTDFGYLNTANGFYALSSNISGGSNTAYGAWALYRNTANSNTAIGEGVLDFNTTGSNNTSIGAYTLSHNQTGSNLTAIGSSADVNRDGYSNSTALGNEAIITGSNQVVLGNSSIANIYAQVTGITALSDNRFKKNIKEDVPGLEFIKLLRPVTYNYDIKGFNTHVGGNMPTVTQQPSVDSLMGRALPKMSPIQPSKEDEAGIAQKEKINYTGLVAQEVEAAANKVGYDFSGLHKPQNDKDSYGLNYTDFVVPLIKSVQELSSSKDMIQNEIDNLKNQNNNLINQNSDLENRLNAMEIKLESLVKSGVSSGSTILSSAKMEQNIPNPFNQTTLINYYVPESAGHAFIKVTGINGNTIKTIQLNGTGSGQITLQTATLASGNYTYSLYVDGNLIDTKVMVLAR